MINALKNLAQMPLNLMAAVAQARPSKHAKGWHKPGRASSAKGLGHYYKDKSRARYVARMMEQAEREGIQGRVVR